MKIAPPAPDETQRLETLKLYDVLDTLPDAELDDLTALAAHICCAPIALVTILDEKRQWFKSHFGLAAVEMPREISFCGHTILVPNLLVVPDAALDERFADNPLVLGEPHIRFYAGVPLMTPTGHSLGALCVIDRIPHEIRPEQVEALRILSRQVMTHFELSRRSRELLLMHRELEIHNNDFRKLNAELEKRVEDRTLELSTLNTSLHKEIAERKLTEIELMNLRRAAEEGNAAKSSFLANMSHEIRTPMNGIIGITYLLQQTHMTLKQSKFVSQIEISTQNLIIILNDILDFAKVEAGKIEMEQNEFNLDEVLSKLDHIAAVQANKKALEFKITVAEDTPMLLIGDPLRLGQILMNLVTNAIKFTMTGSVEVAVSSVNGDSGIATLQFKIHDTGIGLNPRQMALLFEPFGQTDSSTARHFGGTGLGLAISKRFVELMGGSISVQSVVGQGTTFTFTARFAGRTTGKISSALRRGLFSDQRALVIDDNATSRMETINLLTQLWIKTVACNSCQEASGEIVRLSESRLQEYDLLFFDCSSSGKLCVDDAKIMQESCSVTGIPPMILIVSADMADMRVPLHETGIITFLIKPLTRSSLFDAIVLALSKKKGDSQLSKGNHAALRGSRILLVEDNEINQEIAAEVLKMAECQVVVAANGSEALALLNETPPESGFDAVLMDIQMPGLDGYATTRILRLDKRFERLPIIAMTADVVIGVKEMCLAAGMNAYLTKPINPVEVYETLNQNIAAEKNKLP